MPEVEIVERSPRQVVFLRERVEWKDMGAALARLLPAACRGAEELGVHPAGAPFCRYVESDDSGGVIEAGVPVSDRPGEKRVGDAIVGALPGGRVAVHTHKGPYDGLGAAWTEFRNWVEQSGEDPAGDPWDEYVTDPGEVEDPEQWETLLCWPLA